MSNKKSIFLFGPDRESCLDESKGDTCGDERGRWKEKNTFSLSPPLHVSAPSPVWTIQGTRTRQTRSNLHMWHSLLYLSSSVQSRGPCANSCIAIFVILSIVVFFCFIVLSIVSFLLAVIDNG